jgi:hypothetical protein
MDITTLEKQIFIDKSLNTKENWLTLYDHYASIFPTLTPKERYKQAFKVGNFIVRAFKAGDFTADDLKYYLSCLKKFPCSPRDVSQITAQFYLLTGGEPKTLSTKLGGVAVESGTIGISDSNFVPPVSEGSDEFEKNLITSMNEGKIFYCGTSGDGTFDINLRCTDGQEPAVNPAEIGFIIESTGTAIISIPTGNISVTDIGYNAVKSPVQINVDPGNYLVRVHLKDVPDKFFGFVIVVCKTDLPAVNQFTHLEGLG